MVSGANPGGVDPLADERQAVADLSRQLLDAVVAAVPGWVERCVHQRVTQSGVDAPPELAARTSAAADAARTEVATDLARLLDAPVEQRRANPLAVLRAAVRHPTAVLTWAGVPEVVRDEFDERAFPDDRYGLVPATWSDVDPALHEPGIAWSAATAFLVKARRRAREGGR